MRLSFSGILRPRIVDNMRSAFAISSLWLGGGLVVGSVSIRLPDALYWRLPVGVAVGDVGGDGVVRAIVVGGVALAAADA